MTFISHQRYKVENRDYCSHISVTFETRGKFLIAFVRLILGKKGGWRSYRTTKGHWHQIWIWFEGHFKVYRVQTEILAAVFNWVSKQKLNLLLFLSDWYGRKLGLTDLLGHVGKVVSDEKMIFIFHQRNNGGNRYYCNHFLVTFETTGKFLIDFVRLILRKSGAWRSYRATTGNWHQIWIWFKGNFKGFRLQIEIVAAVYDWIFKQQLNLLLFLSDWYCGKLGLTDLPDHDGKVTSDGKMIFIAHQSIMLKIEIIAAIFQ